MHKNTIVCLGTTHVFEYSNLKSLIGSEHFVYLWQTGLRTWEPGDKVKIPAAVSAMRDCLKCDKDKKWR